MEMNQNSARGRKSSEENSNFPIVIADFRDKGNVEAQNKQKRGIGVLKAKSNRIIMGPGTTYDQCFSGSNFASQYEDECPVNYSLKYSETESCKGINKCGNTKKKFKDYADYAETDLDQPTDFSLKYAEKNYEEENKSTAFNYFTAHKVKFKEYTDYVETDLDQPTDFTLKYRESAEEDVKNLDFYYYENEERKASSGFDSRRIRPEEPDETSCERLPERFTCQNETPLMFSRSSSMNSLSSFVHITQSIPDDRSSVVSDFSLMTSGMISPSELPDSPTLSTAPSSPKRHKPSAAYSVKSDFLSKQSVFEDDVTTYKQEDTPIEFSRTTSLSSLNLENPIKSELAIKRNTCNTAAAKEENQNFPSQPQSDYLKQQIVPEKIEHDKGKSELASVLEVDETLCADCISIDIQINCRKPKPNYGRLVVAQENPLRRSNAFPPTKPNLRLRFNNENRKGYASYEGSDDAIHTYHTEGTPANVSHAGSHSDLSALSVASGLPFSGAEDNSDNESFFPEVRETVPVVKSQLEYLKDHQLTAKDETATFATENSPCDFSIRSSLNDLTINVMDPPLSMNRTAACEEPPSQMLSPLRNVSPQSPNSMVSEEAEDAEKCLEESQNEFILTESVSRTNDNWNHPNGEGEKSENISEKPDSMCTRSETVASVNFEFDSNQPLTPFEEALVEECIRLGMPPRKHQKQVKETNLKLSDEGKPLQKRNPEDFLFSKSLERPKYVGEKKTLSNNLIAECDVESSRPGTEASNSAENFDFDTSEPLTPFEEVLVEQCIRLGMPPKKDFRQTKIEGGVKYLSEETEGFDCDSGGLITPLETALVEQCIRLGMLQKKSQKKEGNASSDEPHKAINCLTAHLNRLKLNPENEKERDAFKKWENCPCGKKHNNKRKGASCKRFKNRLDHLKVESCPV